MAAGLLMLDLEGPELTSTEADLVQQPQVGGVILFSRNIQTVQQVQQLIQGLRTLRPDLLIAVDQEGGRVQRVRDGVTQLPPLAVLGKCYGESPGKALLLARELGWLMAAEMGALGFDISFAPVLDLDYGHSAIIGDRAFASDPLQVTALANAYLDGMQDAGMAATGKHFPGHGWPAADSHLALPVDERDFAAIDARDLVPFRCLAPRLRGIMPAHIVYAKVAEQPAGFSPFWLQKILRGSLGFSGVIFSDDLTMEGAASVGGYVQRAEQALSAGCDMVLVCNQRSGALEVLKFLQSSSFADKVPAQHLLWTGPRPDLVSLRDSARWRSVQQAIQTL